MNNSWLRCGSSSEQHVTFDGLQLKSEETYTLYVRAVNNIGLYSNTTQSTVVIESAKPSRTGMSDSKSNTIF